MTKYIKIKSFEDDGNEHNVFIVRAESNKDQILMVYHPYIEHYGKITMVVPSDECVEIEANEYDTKKYNYDKRKGDIQMSIQEKKDKQSHRYQEIKATLDQALADEYTIIMKQLTVVKGEIKIASDKYLDIIKKIFIDEKEVQEIPTEIYFNYVKRTLAESPELRNFIKKTIMKESHKDLYEEYKRLSVVVTTFEDELNRAIEKLNNDIKDKFKKYWKYESKTMKHYSTDLINRSWTTSNIVANPNSDINFDTPMIFTISHQIGKYTDFTLHHNNNKYNVHVSDEHISNQIIHISVPDGSIKLKYSHKDNTLCVTFGDKENLIKIEDKGDKFFKASLRELTTISFIAK